MNFITQRVKPLAMLCTLACLTVGASAQSWFAGIDDPRWSGINGQVLLHNRYVASRSPTDAGQWRGGSITPFHASFRVYSARNGKFMTSFATYTPGQFKVSLPPGDYRIVPETMYGGRVLPPRKIVIGGTQSAPPFNVRVHLFRFTTLKVTYEQGMGY